MRAMILLLAAALWCGGVHAAVPNTINYQGYLTNSAGTPVDGAVVMTFRLYGSASGGSALWTETQLSVTVANGVFSTALGAAIPLPPLPFDVPYWLTVAINADPEMSPRQAVRASPYAIRAANADALAPAATVAGAQVTGLLAGATLPAGNLSGPIGTAQIASNAVTQDKLSPSTGAAAGKVLGTDGNTLQWQTAAAGTVTSVGTGGGLSGGPITTTGTIDINLNGAGGLSKTLGAGSNQLGIAPGGVVPAHLSAAGSSNGQALVSTGAGVAWGSPALPLRKYYLTQTNFVANQAMAACAAGYHMATLMEIFNFNLLQYDTVLGMNGADSGAGGMMPGASGWIRTGGNSSVSSTPGQGNCSLWTSNLHTDYGTQVAFINVWGPTANPPYVAPWWGSPQWCDFPGPVWCVQD